MRLPLPVHLVGLVLALCAGAGLPGSAQGIGPGDAACATVRDDVARLACYDGAVDPRRSGDAGSRWRLYDRDDGTTLALAADGPRRTFDPPALLLARCSTSGLRLRIRWSGPLGDDPGPAPGEAKTVMLRFGTQPALARRWRLSADRHDLIATDADADLLDRMIRVDRLVARTLPLGGRVMAAVFDLRGLRRSLDGLPRNCLPRAADRGWPDPILQAPSASGTAPWIEDDPKAMPDLAAAGPATETLAAFDAPPVP